MHNIRLDIIEQTLIVGNNDCTCFRSFQLVHSFRNNTERINIQTGVCLVENAQTRFQHSHLKNLVPFLLTTGKAFIHRTVSQFIIQLHHRTSLTHQLQKLTGGQRRQTFIFTLLIHSSTHKVHHAHTRDFHRILETKEDSFMATIFGAQLQQILSIKSDRTFCYLKSRITHQYGGKRTFTGTIRSHNSVHLTGIHRQVNTFQYLFAINAGMQVFYF